MNLHAIVTDADRDHFSIQGITGAMTVASGVDEPQEPHQDQQTCRPLSTVRVSLNYRGVFTRFYLGFRPPPAALSR
jgi:hypothetical protein